MYHDSSSWGSLCWWRQVFVVMNILPSTNTMFLFSIYVVPIAAGLRVPWANSNCGQLLSMQHGVLLLIECMRLLPKRDLPRVTLFVFCWMLNFNLFRLLAGRSTMLIVPSYTTKCELRLSCPYHVFLMSLFFSFSDPIPSSIVVPHYAYLDVVVRCVPRLPVECSLNII